MNGHFGDCLASEMYRDWMVKTNRGMKIGFCFNQYLPFYPSRRHLKLSPVWQYSTLRWMIPQWSFLPKRLIFAALCNDLIDYFILCFAHQCNTMRAV